jgi:2-oxoglutarate ferredoxin oxidoreductase subunit delta
MARGRIIVDAERCKGCELCRFACPKDVIKLAETLNSKGYRSAVLLDPEHKCTGCALCAVVCPDGCITVYREIGTRVMRHEKEAQYHASSTT